MGTVYQVHIVKYAESMELQNRKNKLKNGLVHASHINFFNTSLT